VKLRIEKPVYGGSGLARVDGKAVFVPLTLPGEEVEAVITQDKGGYAKAELRSVLEPSPARVEPPCPYFGGCGGCHYQHANYAAQVEMKLSVLRESLERAHLHDVPDIGVVTAEPFGYRNRVRLHVQGKPYSLSYKFRNSSQNVPVNSCPIAAPILQHAIEALNSEVAGAKLAECVTEIELFTDAAESALLVSLWTDRSPSSAKSLLGSVVPTLREILPEVQGVGLFAAERDRAPARLIAHSGSDALLYTSGSATYKVSLGSFFQVNRYLIDPLVQLVTDGEAGGAVWDLYAGVGLFSVPLARTFSSVTTVESSAAAVRDLRENLRSTKHRIVAADTAAFLRQAQTQRIPAPDLLVADPPRAGLGPDVTTALGKIRPRKITCVSCDPATLSRDLAALVQSGYRLHQMRLLDLFPQTFHLESVTHLVLE
jgi:23S rRNA (uracil1939-C5)-methyltransferase